MTHTMPHSDVPKRKPLVLPESLVSLMRGRRVVCSFSGGSDSLALLLMLLQICEKEKIMLEALHFEHGIRGAESLQDADFCCRFCEECGIPFTRIPLAVPEHRLHGESLEAAARRLRLNGWREYLRGDSRALVALGHHADDRLENLILRLARGSNASGLTSMRPVQLLGTLTLIRPLLQYTRQEIQDFLNDVGMTLWCHDSTNQDDAYQRNYLRNEFFPALFHAMPSARGGFLQSIKTLEDDASALEDLALERVQNMMGTTGTDRSFWRMQPNAIRVRMLRLWCSDCAGHSWVPDSNVIDRFHSALDECRDTPIRICLNELDATLVVSGSEVQFFRRNPDPGPVLWEYEQTPELLWGQWRLTAELVSSPEIGVCDANSALFDRTQLPSVLLVSSRSDGDFMIPMGANHPKRVKKILSDSHIASESGRQLPFLRNPADGSILWIPLVRRSHAAPVDDSTDSVLSVRVFRLEE